MVTKTKETKAPRKSPAGRPRRGDVTAAATALPETEGLRIARAAYGLKAPAPVRSSSSSSFSVAPKPTPQPKSAPVRISELYGPVRQGEGLLLGENMPFIRVAGCNLSCSWCDSSYTWVPGYAYESMTAQQVIAWLDGVRGACRWVSITGGEPTLYAAALLEIVHALKARDLCAIIETNGLRHVPALAEHNVFVSCSPKLPGSGQDNKARRAKVRAFVSARNQTPAMAGRTQYKFVIAQDEDLFTLEEYCADVGITLGYPGLSPVYVQPDGYIAPVEEYLFSLRWLQDRAPAGVRVTPQVHRLVHGPDARSV